MREEQRTRDIEGERNRERGTTAKERRNGSRKDPKGKINRKSKHKYAESPQEGLREAKARLWS